MVQFRADSDPETTGDGRFTLQSSGDVTVDPPPHDAAYFGNQLLALSNYYSRVSGGRLVLSAELHPRTIELPDSMGRYYYGDGDADVTRGTAVLFRDAIRQADADGVRFSSYDCFIVFHAGVGRDINLDYDATPKDIPSVFLGLKDLKQALPAGEFNGDGLSVQNGAFGVAEGILLGIRAGLDPRPLVEALSGGAAQSWVLTNRSGRMIDDEYPLGFKVALHRKDLRIALEMAA
jgi:hypothetical protein